MLTDTCGRLYYWPQFSTPSYVQALCHVTLQWPPTVCKMQVSTPKLSHMLGFDWWDISLSDTTRNLKSTCLTGLAHNCASATTMTRTCLKLVPWFRRMTDMWRGVQSRLANYSQPLIHEWVLMEPINCLAMSNLDQPTSSWLTDV